MKLIWLTDIHLNFLEKETRLNFYQDIIKTNSDAVLITGDIAEAPSVGAILREMGNSVKKPIYFVLGNHDYYRSEVDVVKKEMEQLTRDEALLNWLPHTGHQVLDKDIILVGQDGWADGRLGDYHNSCAVLNDSRMITDLFQAKLLGKNKLLEKMQQLADGDALQLKDQLEQAIESQPKKIIILTHVPPFKETCLYEGKISNDDYLPYFTSKVVGDILMQFAGENPGILFLTFCGHTHCEAIYNPLDNLIVKTGRAEYCQPEIHELITL